MIDTLIDPLPFLEVGYWVGAHHGALVPKDVIKKATASAKPATRKSAAQPSGPAGLSGRTGGQFDSAANGPSGADYAAMMGGMNMANMPGMPGMAGGGGTRTIAEGDFQKTQAEWIMVRALDFDVKPDATYRYRLRIVVANPNLNIESVAPGVDNKSKELEGPWTPPTQEVNVPSDVATYLAKKSLSNNDASGSKVEFQVVKWSPEDGLTVVKSFDESPGKIIGQLEKVSVPNEKKDGRASKPYDFTSHQVLADAMTGSRPASELQALGLNKPIEPPALAVVVRPDGILVVRDQATDASNGEMAEMKEIYDQILKELEPGKKKSSSTLDGASMYGMGGGMSGAR